MGIMNVCMDITPVFALRIVASVALALGAWYVTRRIDRDLLKRFGINSFVRVAVFLCVYLVAAILIGIIIIDGTLFDMMAAQWMQTIPVLLQVSLLVIRVVAVVVGVKIAADVTSVFIDNSRKAITAKLKLKNIQIDLLKEFVKWVLYSVALLIMLNLFHLEGVATTLLASAGVLGIVIGFATQNVMQGFVAGVVIGLDRSFEVGDSVKIGDTQGVIEKIKARTTRVKTGDGYIVVMPNSKVSESIINNYSKRSFRRINLRLEVARKDQDKALQLIRKKVLSLPWLLKDKTSEAFVESYGSIAYNRSLTSVIRILLWSSTVDYFKNFKDSIGLLDALTRKARIACYGLIKE